MFLKALILIIFLKIYGKYVPLLNIFSNTYYVAIFL